MPAPLGAAKPGPTDPERTLRIQQDHDAIARLADDILPALIAKLTSGGLGEIEVRQGGWKARLRKPATAVIPMRQDRAKSSPCPRQWAFTIRGAIWLLGCGSDPVTRSAPSMSSG